jgi:hypothetical protein
LFNGRQTDRQTDRDRAKETGRERERERERLTEGESMNMNLSVGGIQWQKISMISVKQKKSAVFCY